MKIEAGKRYKTRGVRHVTALVRSNRYPNMWFIEDENGQVYSVAENGCSYEDGSPSIYDLVEELPPEPIRAVQENFLTAGHINGFGPVGPLEIVAQTMQGFKPGMKVRITIEEVQE